MDKKSVYSKIGKNIARIRKKCGYTQERFAELMGKSWSSIAKLETGMQNVSIGKLMEIAKFLGVDFREFFEFDA